MKKKYLFLLVFIPVYANFLSAAEFGNNNFSLGLSFGLISGESREIVYHDEVTDNYLSQLLWFMRPLPVLGVDLRYSRENRTGLSNFFTNASFKFGIPAYTGRMENRDWLYPERPNFLTHYSVHDNRTRRALLGDFDIGKSFSLYNDFRLGAFLSYRFMHFYFAASRGSFLYPPGQGGHFYTQDPRILATYRQTWHIASPGLSFYGVFNQFFDIKLSFRASPFIWASSIDRHLARALTVTNDSMTGGWFFEPDLLFSFKPNSAIALVFSLNYRHISGTRGDSTYRDPVMGTMTFENTGGAGFGAFNLGLGVRFNFL